MLRLAAGFGHQSNNVLQCLTHLCDKIRAVEMLLGVPADLTGQKYRAPFRGDAVGKTSRLFPMSGMKKFKGLAHLSRLAHCAPGLSRKRWIFPVCVFGSASMNFTDRGYLNGAMVALT